MWLQAITQKNAQPMLKYINPAKRIIILPRCANHRASRANQGKCIPSDREKLKKSTCKLLTYSGHQMSPLSHKSLICMYKGQRHKVEFHIMEKDAPAILRLVTCQKLGMVKRTHDVTVKDIDIVKDFSDLFCGLGCMPGPHHIQLDPPVEHTPRKVPVPLKDKIVEELNRTDTWK